MPFKSKAQQKFFGAKESKGELPKGTTSRWAKHTPDMKKLPEHKKKAAIASPSEVGIFVKAAMARYAELGVPKDIAEELFARKMTKIAEQLGMALPVDPSQRIVKLATAKLTAKGIPEEQARVMLTHEFSKQAFIEKVARVKRSVLSHIKKAQTAQDADFDKALASRDKLQKKVTPLITKKSQAPAPIAPPPVIAGSKGFVQPGTRPAGTEGKINGMPAQTALKASAPIIPKV